MAPKYATAPREGLVPRRIVDVNGVPKTVWVKPEDAADSRHSRLADLKPQLKANLEENLRDLKSATRKKPDPMGHTEAERERWAERGYATETLHEAAARRFEAEFGVPFGEAPPPHLTDERIYDYIAHGIVDIGQAMGFAEYGIEPQLSHPVLDPEYTFLLGPKMAKADLRRQRSEDTPARKAEMRDIERTARLLQENGIGAHAASACIKNGLRIKHLQDPKIDPMEAIKVSAENSVDSDRFKALTKKGPKQRDPRAKPTIRERVGRRLKIWGRRMLRRMFNAVRRRVRRILRKTFLPWEVR